MPTKSIVLDANILIRAVLGQKVGLLIAHYSQTIGFYVAELNYNEALHYLEHLTQARGIRREIWTAALEACMTAIQIIPTAECDLVRERAFF
jgi:predicted nucleic acid-binding protein